MTKIDNICFFCRLFGFIARVPGVSGASFYCYIFECDTSGEPVCNLSAEFSLQL